MGECIKHYFQIGHMPVRCILLLLHQNSRSMGSKVKIARQKREPCPKRTRKNRKNEQEDLTRRKDGCYHDNSTCKDQHPRIIRSRKEPLNLRTLLIHYSPLATHHAERRGGSTSDKSHQKPQSPSRIKEPQETAQERAKERVLADEPKLDAGGDEDDCGEEGAGDGRELQVVPHKVGAVVDGSGHRRRPSGDTDADG